MSAELALNLNAEETNKEKMLTHLPGLTQENVYGNHGYQGFSESAPVPGKIEVLNDKLLLYFLVKLT